MDKLLDLAVMAMKCDLARVVLISLGSSQHQKTFPFLRAQVGGTTMAVHANHSVSHLQEVTAENSPVTPMGEEMCRVKNRWSVSQFGKLLRKMKAVSEGGGNLLDHSAVAGFSDMGDSRNHYWWHLPVLVAGRVGGLQHGRYVKYICQGSTSGARYFSSCPNPPNDYYNASISKLWLTMMRAVGAAPANQGFGDAGPSDTLPGLWPAA
jgi:hypothetical protein